MKTEEQNEVKWTRQLVIIAGGSVKQFSRFFFCIS